MSSRAFAAAALVLVPFALVVAAFAGAAPWTDDQLAAADPLVRALVAWPGFWSIPAAALVVAAARAAIAPPNAVDVAHALRRAALGAACAVAGLVALRIVLGPALPSFIPPEEGAKPGWTLGLAAGVIEETVFRLAILPAAWGLARRRLLPRPAAAAAALATGVLFALAHEVGPGAGPTRADLLVVRTLVPGAAMSALAFGPGPAFVVALHASAHLVLPALFD